MRSQRILTIALTGTILTTSLTACGSQLEPKLELRKAGSSLADAESAEYTLRLVGDEDTFAALYKETIDEANTVTEEEQAEALQREREALAAFCVGMEDEEACINEAMTEAGGMTQEPVEPYVVTEEDRERIRQVLALELTLAYDENGEGEKDDAARFAVTYKGGDAVDVRLVENMLYAKLELDEAAKDLEATGMLEESRTSARAETPDLAPLLDGEWMGADLTQLLSYSEELGEDLERSDLEAGKYTAELTRAAEAILKSAKVTRDEEDPNHLIAETTTTAAAEEARKAAEALNPGIVEQSPLGEDVPEEAVRLDVYVNDGEFEAFELDLTQFSDGVSGKAAIRLESAEDVEIEKPEGANVLDVEKVLSPVVEASKDAAARRTLEAIDREAMALAAFDSQAPSRKHLEEALTGFDEETHSKLQVTGDDQVQYDDGENVLCLTVSSEMGEAGTVTDGPC